MAQRVLIAEARFYTDIADTMFEAACKILDAAHVTHDRVAVPGSFELAPAIAMAADSGKYHGFLALGCIIKGQTNHFEIVCNETSRALQSLAVERRMPLGFGLVTAYTEQQAWARARETGENYGGRAATACLRMMELRKHFQITGDKPQKF